MRHFGVEVECYRMDIRAAAVAAVIFFGTYRYEDTGRKYGRATWSAYDKKGREWKFQVEPAVRWISGSEKCEVITPILEHDDLVQLEGLLAELEKLGAGSDAEHLCAVHVHVGTEDYSAKELADLVYAIAAHQDSIIADFGVSDERLKKFCRLVPVPFAIKAKREGWSIENMVEKWRQEDKPKMHLLNILPAAEHGNVEYRMFQFSNGMDMVELRQFVDFSLAVTESVKQGVFSKEYREWLKLIGFEEVTYDDI